MNNPKISIIVPVYNVEKYLRRCLDSIVAQTFTDWECICVDDGSPDNSGEILDEYAAKDKRFVIIHKENGGVSSARNAGLDTARGEYVTFCDSDDWIETDFCEHCYLHADENTILQLGFRIVLKNKIIEMDKETRVFAGEWAVVWRHVFPRVIIEHLRFDEDLISGEDYLFICSAILKTSNVMFVPKAVYNYNVLNPTSAMHHISHRNVFDQFQATEKVQNLLLDKNNQLSYANDLQCRLKWCDRQFIFFMVYNRDLPLLVKKIIFKLFSFIYFICFR